MAQKTSSRNSKLIKASPLKLYRSFTDPEALAIWMAPGDMEASVHNFELKPGGSYTMSLYYPDSMKDARGKTNAKEDRFTARFIELIPEKKIVEAIRFDSDDPAFAGEMIMEVRFEAKGMETEVIMEFRDIPPGIRPEDNEKGTRSSLEKLALYVE